jgi:hypothetical protein
MLSSPSPFASLPLSYGSLLAIGWVVPSLIAALGVWAVFAYVCCRPSRWQKVPAAAMAAALFVAGPLLLLASGVLFALALVASDVCSGGANIAYNLALSRGDALCGDAGGVGTAAACTFALALDVPGGGAFAFNTTLALPAVAAAALGRCPPRGAPEPLAPALRALAAALRAQPGALAAAALNGTALTGGLQLAPPVQAVGAAAAAAAGAAAADFVATLANTTLACATLADVVTEAKDAVCCTVVTPFFWYAALWYVASLVLVLVGLPLAILGRKRLPQRVWGRAAIDAADRVESIAEALASAKALAATTRGSRAGGSGTDGAMATTGGASVGGRRKSRGERSATAGADVDGGTPARGARVAPASVRIDERPRGPTPSATVGATATAGSVVTDDDPTRTVTRA